MEPAPLTLFFALDRMPAFSLMALWTSCEDLQHELVADFCDRFSRQNPRRRASSAAAGAQRAGLVAAIGAVMAHLDRPDTVRRILGDAARSLSGQALAEDDYRRAAHAIRAACAQVLAPSYTHEHDVALETLCEQAMRTMLDAAKT